MDATTGSDTIVYKFKGGKDGAKPETGLTELSGAFYGVTNGGGGTGCGGGGCGTVFKIGISGNGYSVLAR